MKIETLVVIAGIVQILISLGCIVLILVDTFLHYPQRDKIAVFCKAKIIFFLCVIQAKRIRALTWGCQLDRDNLMRWSFILLKGHLKDDL